MENRRGPSYPRTIRADAANVMGEDRGRSTRREWLRTATFGGFPSPPENPGNNPSGRPRVHASGSTWIKKSWTTPTTRASMPRTSGKFSGATGRTAKRWVPAWDRHSVAPTDPRRSRCSTSTKRRVLAPRFRFSSTAARVAKAWPRTTAFPRRRSFVPARFGSFPISAGCKTPAGVSHRSRSRSGERWRGSIETPRISAATGSASTFPDIPPAGISPVVSSRRTGDKWDCPAT